MNESRKKEKQKKERNENKKKTDVKDEFDGFGSLVPCIITHVGLVGVVIKV